MAIDRNLRVLVVGGHGGHAEEIQIGDLIETIKKVVLEELLDALRAPLPGRPVRPT